MQTSGCRSSRDSSLWTERNTDGCEQCCATLPSTPQIPRKISTATAGQWWREKIAFQLRFPASGVSRIPFPVFSTLFWLPKPSTKPSKTKKTLGPTDRERLKERTQMDQRIFYGSGSKPATQVIIQARQLDHQAAPGLTVELGRVPQQGLCITGPRGGAPWSTSK